MNKCKHKWRMFHDPKLKGSGYLSLYCNKCLELRKIKKEYKQN